MSDDDSLNPDTDPFKPPSQPVEVHCLHCGQEYDSYLIEWRIETDREGKKHGFWCCPTPGCDGRGFGFDIFPTDPEYRGEDGEAMWSFDDDDDEEGEPVFEEEDEEFNPADYIPESMYNPAPADFDGEKEMDKILSELGDSVEAKTDDEDEDDDDDDYQVPF